MHLSRVSISNTNCQHNNLQRLRIDSQATSGKYCVKKAELIPIYKLENNYSHNLKIHHATSSHKCLSRCLAGLTASLFISDEEVRHIMVDGRRLLTPLPKMLPDPESRNSSQCQNSHGTHRRVANLVLAFSRMRQAS